MINHLSHDENLDEAVDQIKLLAEHVIELMVAATDDAPQILSALDIIAMLVLMTVTGGNREQALDNVTTHCRNVRELIRTSQFITTATQ